MRNRIARIIGRSLLVTLVAACGIALAACSQTPDPEQVVRDQITSALDQVRNLDDATIDEVMEAMDTSALEPYGVDGTELVKSLFDGFDYSIESVTVDGDTAVAEVSVTAKNATSLYGEIESLSLDLMNDPSILEIATDEQALNQRVGELVMQAMDDIQPETKTIELNFSQVDGDWEMDLASGAVLSQIFV